MKKIHNSSVVELIRRVRAEAQPKRDHVSWKTMGRERVFTAYDWGGDTFVFEQDVWKLKENHIPILIVRKSDLIKGAHGYIMTMTTGNHTIAAIPLLSGQFWNLGRVPAAQRSRTLQFHVVCANVVNGKIEISQRDVSTETVTAADRWLQNVGFAMNDVVMAERNDAALEHYRRLGQEWRVKPLVWTRREMDAALDASRTRINSALQYYHSAKGVHFLAYDEFHTLLKLVTQDYAGTLKCLRELVSIFEGEMQSCMRTHKFQRHNEIELFGPLPGEALKRIVPSLEQLMEDITLKRITQADVKKKLTDIDAAFKAALEHPDMAKPGSKEFVETMYMNLTGEVYSKEEDTASLAFDAHRTALPGATFCGGRPNFHPGADERSRVLLTTIEQMVSQAETIEYANIYEVRSKSESSKKENQVGEGITREVVFKTNRRPLRTSMIEKKLALKTPDYGKYMLARVEAFKALGVDFGEYRPLAQTTHHGCTTGKMNYFIRNRYPGEPLDDITKNMFLSADGETEDPEVVLKLAALLGNAAAQNLALKKYLKDLNDCWFGVGKEIFEFGYDSTAKRAMPMNVWLCSIRGSLGWKSIAQTKENLADLFDFYFACYARVLHRYWLMHHNTVPLEKVTEKFFDGFEFKTREMHWNYLRRREEFNAFDPHLHHRHAFTEKWQFALWALNRQFERIEDGSLRELFMQKVKIGAS